MNETKTISRNLPMIIATLVIGTLAGTSSMLLSLFLDQVERFFLGFNENFQQPVAINALPIRRLGSVLVGGIIAALIWYWLQKRYSPVKIQDAIENGAPMPFWYTWVHVLTQIFFVGTGGSIGRELAPREAGAMLAHQWTKLSRRFPRMNLSPEDRRLLITSAAGAGFAGVYIAPITGMMFALELLYKKISARATAVSLTSSVIATLIGSLAKGWDPYYHVTNLNFSAKSIPWVLVLGLLMGIGGTWFKAGIKKAGQRRFKDQRLLVTLPVVALLTGIIAMGFPQIMGNGRGIAQLAIDTTSISTGTIAIMVAALLAKAIVTLMTIAGGGYGGTLTPSIAVGAAAGIVVGTLWMQFIGGDVLLSQCAIVGAAALLTASQQAPLMSLFMITEVCHLNYSALMPLGLAVAVSIAVSKLMQGRH